MAFIDNQDENQLDPNAPQGQGQGQTQQPLVGQGSTAVGGSQGASSAGVGPGGTGGWTNIQAYLDANKGDTGSAQLLGKTVGDQFGQERSNFQNDSSKFLTDAQTQADANKITDDQAGSYINQAAGEYSYPGADPKGSFEYAPLPTGGMAGTPQDKATPSPTQPTVQSPTDPSQQADYASIVSKFQKALNDPYSGPTSYDYGFGDQTQQYGADLKDNPSFDTLMQNIYSTASGNPLTSGQYDLQKQLDVNNQALGDTRNSLNDQYSQLTADRDKTVADTTTGLSNIEQGYRQNQSDLYDYLTGQSNTEDQTIGQEEAAARDAYNKDYTTGQSGDASINYQNMLNNADAGDISGPLTQARINQRVGLGIWGDNLNWNQLQNEQNDRYSGGALSPWTNNELYGSADNRATSDADWANRLKQLNNFYGNEDQKYVGTADQDKRQYNAIQDFLNSGVAKKDQTFQVRS